MVAQHGIWAKSSNFFLFNYLWSQKGDLYVANLMAGMGSDVRGESWVGVYWSIAFRKFHCSTIIKFCFVQGLPSWVLKYSVGLFRKGKSAYTTKLYIEQVISWTLYFCDKNSILNDPELESLFILDSSYLLEPSSRCQTSVFFLPAATEMYMLV